MKKVKYVIPLILVLISLIFYLCFPIPEPEPKPEFKGTWKLIYGEHRQKDGNIIPYPILTGEHYLVINENFFATVFDDTAKNKSAKYPGFNIVKYELNNNFLSCQYLISHWGKICWGYKFYQIIKFKNDHLFTVPADEAGNEVQYGYFEEWEKLE